MAQIHLPHAAHTALRPPVHSSGISAFTPAPATTHTCTLAHTDCARSSRPLHTHTSCLHAWSHRPTPAQAQAPAPSLCTTLPCTSMHTYVTQVHSDTHSPPRTLWHTRTCHLLADLRAACTHTRMHTHKYSLAGSLHPLEQRPLSGHLVHSHIPPQGDSLHTMLHTGPHHPLALQPLVRTLPETAAGS